jgi:hypothetical protein
MHFKHFDSGGRSKTFLELQLYIAPLGFENDENSTVADKLLSESIYIGSSYFDLKP